MVTVVQTGTISTTRYCVHTVLCSCCRRLIAQPARFGHEQVSWTIAPCTSSSHHPRFLSRQKASCTTRVLTPDFQAEAA
ncbi:hypothetical protein N656DRAFT_831483 [Canariomyces notabilis]|uniref:Uncharacterized protein n=1 Tax=Canariomyces notabilis TaxID=2074819 RepID=A0AAN6QN65_9PEZI|nr:hypothetical protein N656DRAFT_831483 [Canariomyces arenarius]